MLPIEWRAKAGLSQEAVARALGLGGRNPARTWSRYERGERQPRAEMIAAVEKLTRGKVTATSWVQARETHLAPTRAGAPASRAEASR